MCAEQCAQRVMALVENNESKGDDEEQSSDSLGTIQKEMLPHAVQTVHPRSSRIMKQSGTHDPSRKVQCDSYSEEPECLFMA